MGSRVVTEGVPAFRTFGTYQCCGGLLQRTQVQHVMLQQSESFCCQACGRQPRKTELPGSIGATASGRTRVAVGPEEHSYRCSPEHVSRAAMETASRWAPDKTRP